MIDRKKTMDNFKVFISSYKTSKECYEHGLNEKYHEYEKLHTLYVMAYSAIQHHNPSKTDRRRLLFDLAYMQGKAQKEIVHQVNLCEDTIREEVRNAMIQFCEALEIAEYC